MTPQTAPAASPMQLLRMSDGLIIQELLYLAAKLGVADLLQDGPRSVPELASRLEVNEQALYRILRALAAQGVFEETAPHAFANTELSRFLCTGVPGSIRSAIIFRGSEFVYPPLERSCTASRPGSRPERC